jgi:putative transposase
MLLGKKYRIYPTVQQQSVLDSHMNAVRYIYNLALETKTTAYQKAGVNLTRYDLQKQLKDLKQDCEWLKAVNSQSLQVAIMNLDAAYTSFFKGGGFPSFKKKGGTQSFNCPQNFSIEDGKLFIPKLRTGIKIVLHRDLGGEMRNATISKTATGKYFVSILVNDGIEKQSTEIVREKSVGVDLGIKTFAVLSDGTEFQNPKYLKKSLQRLKILQKRLSKKVKTSKNRNKARHKVALLHEKVANQRKDFLHKTSNSITKNYDTVCFEDLNVKGMIKNHKLAQSISDVGWNMFATMCKYKAKNYLEIGRFQPSSKLCGCGVINKELTLQDREWTCKSCGTTNQRDLLAANNIRNFAIINSGQEMPVVPVELPTIVGAMKQEAHQL